MNDERAQKFLSIALGVTALLLASSLLVAVINLGAQIATFWLLLFVQISRSSRSSRSFFRLRQGGLPRRRPNPQAVLNRRAPRCPRRMWRRSKS